MKGRVPAAPFIAILNERLERLILDEKSQRELAQEVGMSRRNLSRLMSGQPTMSFDNADRIVTRTLGPMAWWEDETLCEIYLSADLTKLDERDKRRKEAA